MPDDETDLDVKSFWQLDTKNSTKPLHVVVIQSDHQGLEIHVRFQVDIDYSDAVPDTDTLRWLNVHIFPVRLLAVSDKLNCVIENLENVHIPGRPRPANRMYI